MFKRKNREKLQTDTERITNEFLANDYLDNPYIVPAHVDEGLQVSVEHLSALPGFLGLVNVGSTANGSWELRQRTGGKLATDLDFYLVGTSELNLAQASQIVQNEMRQHGIALDGVLNGRNPDEFLNIEKLESYIGQDEQLEGLLALPFQSYYGNDQFGLQRRIIETVLQSDQPQEAWDLLASFHAQSLSLHHGTFSHALSERIMQDFYPAKIEKFELPVTPQAALEQLP